MHSPTRLPVRLPLFNGPTVDAHAPGHDTDDIYTRAGFKVTVRKLPILKAGPIEDMTKRLGIAPPEMIFGDNLVRMEHPESGWRIEFNAFDALDRVDKTGNSMLKVSYSEEWQQNRQKQFEEIKEVIKPFDWSYSTDYKGTTAGPQFQPTEKRIPYHILKLPEKILFWREAVLYEDELADNGIAMLSCKVRVMPERMYLLSRFFMRLDGVLFRIRDTRVYIDLRTREVLREYRAHEERYDIVRAALAGTKEDPLAGMRDPNRLVDEEKGVLVPVVEMSLDRVVLE